ncbi:MAG: hypothetical protein GY851_07240 [bacterium]|nr:hypothetical protein [bacterium]
MKEQMVIWAVLAGLLAGAAAYAATDDEGTRFAQPERLAGLMDSSPRKVVKALESVLTQEQADALAKCLFPAADAAAKAAAVELAVTALRDAGLEESDTALAALKVRLTELREDVE